MDNPPEHWDVAVLGTGLTESITAAALAKSGKKVLHLDENDYYGGDSASLALHELLEWVKERQQPPSSEDAPAFMTNQRALFTSVTCVFPASDHPSTPPPSLLQESRQYSISLSPALVPSNGPTIDSLIASGVSRYGGYRLLDAVAVFSQTDPARGTLKKVPASKEDVFKDKEMSLIEKRRLMKFLMFAAGDFESSDLLTDQNETPFIPYLQEKFSLSPQISAAIAFAIGHCSTAEPRVLPTIERIRHYLRSSGKYGNSPFLVGHYGGAGEISQGFCRTAAVQGATYILGRGIESIRQQEDDAKFTIQMEGFLNPLTADVIVASESYSHLHNTSQTGGDVAQSFIIRCIAILDSPISLPASNAPQPEDVTVTSMTADTLLVVFPPGALAGRSTAGPVTALQTGDGTMCCPSGKYLLYLTTLAETPTPTSEISPSEILTPFLDALLPVPRPTLQDDGESDSQTPSTSTHKPLLTVFYKQKITSPPEPTSKDYFVIPSVLSSDAILTEMADESSRRAEKMFWDVVNRFREKGGFTEAEDGIDTIWGSKEGETQVDDDDW